MELKVQLRRNNECDSGVLRKIMKTVDNIFFFCPTTLGAILCVPRWIAVAVALQLQPVLSIALVTQCIWFICGHPLKKRISGCIFLHAVANSLTLSFSSVAISDQV
jgi:hypothetical protein